MEEQKYSLSYYFEELKRKQMKNVERGGREISSEETSMSTTISVEVLKTLKDAAEQKMSLTALAKAVHLKLGPFEELVEHLQEEQLIELEPDENTGNDLVKLTQKGSELF
jgi:predicted transcriptional regulator